MKHGVKSIRIYKRKIKKQTNKKIHQIGAPEEENKN